MTGRQLVYLCLRGGGGAGDVFKLHLSLSPSWLTLTRPPLQLFANCLTHQGRHSLKASAAQTLLYCSISFCRHRRDSHWQRQSREMLVVHGGAYRDNRCVNGGFTLINLLRRFFVCFCFFFCKRRWSEYRLFSQPLCFFLFLWARLLAADQTSLNSHVLQLKRQNKQKLKGRTQTHPCPPALSALSVLILNIKAVACRATCKHFVQLYLSCTAWKHE